MQFTGPALEIAHFLALAALVLVIGRIATGTADPWVRRARAACVLAVLLMSFKAGFVRHDIHAAIAWRSLAVLGIVVLAEAWRAHRRAWVKGVAASAVVLCLVADVGWGGRYARLPTAVMAKVGLLDRPRDRLVAAAAALRDPRGWSDGLRARFDEALAGIRSTYPLPLLAGSVDLVPSEQASVIARGLDYRPRPVFQEFSVYTPALIAANRAFLFGPGGPRTILFDTETIDRRLPAQVEGAIWPDLARWFDPVATAGTLVVLERRAAPRPVTLGPATTLHRRRDRDIRVPDLGDRPVWTEIGLRQTIGGHLVEFAFKAPIVRVDLRTGSGAGRNYRVLPARAGAGFVLSPLVRRGPDAVPVLTGAATPGLERVVSMRVRIERWGRRLYHRHFDVRFAPLVVDGAG
jgi:hypothetical protein